MTPEVGKTYNVTHSRKGAFTLRVDSIEGEWVEGEIVAGEAEMLSLSNANLGPGDQITVSASLCVFEEKKA